MLNHSDDLTLLFAGFLLTLSVYNFLLYFQHKSKVYLLYSLYTFLIFTSVYPEQSNSFYVEIEDHSPYLHFLVVPRAWIYNSLYLLFAKALMELDVYRPKVNNFLNKGIQSLFVILVISMVYAFLSGEINIVGKAFAYIFSPAIAVLGLIGLYVVYTLDTPLKYYVLVGSLVYLILAESAYYLPFSEETGTIVFHTGVVIENMLFSLALGYKQKVILQDKNKSQKALIVQLKENDKLRHTIHEQLKEDVEQARIAQLNTMYEKELVELKISSLRSQMNPHFIFNSLNAIKLYIIDSDKENAVYYLNKFSKLIRKILASTREKEISLADEIETAKLYLEIENIRFNNEIESSFEIDERLSLQTIKLPSLILQPFIENAIWHGLSPKKGDKQIHISFEKKDQSHLIITIVDNGIGRQKSAKIKSKKIHKRESVGIKLTEERLVNFCKNYTQKCAIKYFDLFEHGNPSGTKVILQIPLT